MRENESINLKDLVAGYQQLVGDFFIVGLDGDYDVNRTKIPLVMMPIRNEYKITNIDTEALQITFSTYVKCEPIEYYEDILLRLHKLIGHNEFNITSNGRSYKCHSFMDFTRPMSDPVVDSGKFWRTLTIYGTCLISGDHGALVGNDIITEIIFNPGLESELKGIINVLESSVSINKELETPQMANAISAKAFSKNQLLTHTYKILILKNIVCERLVKACMGITPFGLNERIDIKNSFPIFDASTFNVTNQLIFSNININRTAGAFVSCELTLHEKLIL